ASPACTPGAVSVGAVYSGNFGGVGWGACTDSTTAADKVTCFSNSASFLSVLAPGAIITAGGVSLGGTSQAAPFIAGSVAVLRAAYPAETLDQTVSRITSSGSPVTDARNGLSKPRLNLQAAAGVGNSETSGSQDVPTLPEWAAILAAALFMLIVVRRQRPSVAH
ncbi:MAG: S8 family serine peptidase, partial [Rhodocyclaceae bacterium]